MKQYDLSKTVVHYETKEQFDEVLRWHESKNNVWASGYKPFDVDIDNYFSYYNNDLCVILGNIFYSKVLSYAQKEGYTILPFSDFERDFLSPSKPSILKYAKNIAFEIISFVFILSLFMLLIGLIEYGLKQIGFNKSFWYIYGCIFLGLCIYFGIKKTKQNETK